MRIHLTTFSSASDSVGSPLQRGENSTRTRGGRALACGILRRCDRFDIQNVLEYTALNQNVLETGEGTLRMSVRLKDIAERLGISITTVSRALGGYPEVADETRQRVEKAAREVGYVPDATARRLRQRKTDTIGFIIPTFGPRFSDPFFSELLAGIGNEASRQQMDLLVATRAPGPSEIETYERWVGSSRVDGFIVVRTRRDDARIRFLAGCGALFVAFGRSAVPVDFPYVGVDSELGMYMAARHLVERGHRRIAYIGPPADLQFAVHRLMGVKRALYEGRLSLPENLHLDGDLTQESGYRIAKQLLDVSPRPTAIMCANDLMALGAMRAIQELGLAVGVDVAVTGFDDVPLAEHAFPSLTTVHQPVYRIGGLACQMLVNLIRGEELGEKHRLLTPDLMIRDSTAK